MQLRFHGLTGRLPDVFKCRQECNRFATTKKSLIARHVLLWPKKKSAFLVEILPHPSANKPVHHLHVSVSHADHDAPDSVLHQINQSILEDIQQI